MKASKLIAGFSLIAGLFASLAFADTDSYTLDTHGVDLTIDITRQPVFPQGLLMQGYTEGKVKIVFEVDHTGELRDWMDLESTHPSFVDAIDRVIESWQFSPPRINGESRTIVAQMDINFLAKGVVLSFDLSSGLHSVRFNEVLGKFSERSKVSSPDELDEPIRPLLRKAPLVSKNQIQKHTGSKVSFKFYVDEQGRVRVPTIYSTDGEVELGMILAVQDALGEWRFTPPTRKSHPTKVQLEQTFVFAER